MLSIVLVMKRVCKSATSLLNVENVKFLDAGGSGFSRRYAVNFVFTDSFRL